MFLKFIGFTKKLEYEIRKFDSIPCQVIIFRVKNFSDECNYLFKSSNNFYKIDQVKKFLRQLQQKTFIEIFNDSYYVQTLVSQHQTIIEMDSLVEIH